MTNFLTTQSVNAQINSASQSNKLTDTQLRQLVVKALDSAEFNKNKADDLEKKIKELASADSNTIAALEKERDGFKNTAELLTEQAKFYKQALNEQKASTLEAETGRDIAIKEVDRQKHKVSLWKKLTKISFVIGAGVGIGTVLALQN